MESQAVSKLGLPSGVPIATSTVLAPSFFYFPEYKFLVSILYDIFLGLELVHHRIHVFLASIAILELKGVRILLGLLIFFRTMVLE